jgi:hypothetical protein
MVSKHPSGRTCHRIFFTSIICFCHTRSGPNNAMSSDWCLKDTHDSERKERDREFHSVRLNFLEGELASVPVFQTWQKHFGLTFQNRVCCCRQACVIGCRITTWPILYRTWWISWTFRRLSPCMPRMIAGNCRIIRG